MTALTRKQQFLSFLTLVIIVAAIYVNTLGVPFVFDDVPNIKHNPHITHTRFSSDGLLRAGFESPMSSRPVAYISFGLNYYFGGYNVFGYHVVNIVIHLITGFLLFVFVQTTLLLSLQTTGDGCGPKPSAAVSVPARGWRSLEPSWVSFWTAALWLVHPVQTQSVTYIVQRMNSMATLFFVLSLLLYARGRISQKQGANASGRTRAQPYMWFGGSLLGGLLALGSKEIAATLPFFIFLYEWYFFQDLSRLWLKRYWIWVVVIPIIFVLVVAIYLGAHPWDKILASYAGRDFTPLQRVLTEFRVVIFYLSLLLWPHPSRLNLEHDFTLSYSLFDPVTTALSLGLLLGLLVLGVVLAPRQRILSFCLLWFLGNLVIESSVIGLELVFEHRLYMPSMFMILAVVMLFCRYVRHRWLQAMLLAAVVMAGALGTFERNKVWQDEVTLLRDCIAKSPRKARSYYNLGIALAERGHADEAIKHYRAALQINPGYAAVHTNLGIELYRLGKEDEALDHYAKALEINPDFENAHIQLGVALAGTGRIADAIYHYMEALRINPASADAQNNLGNIYLKQGRLEKAMQHYAQVIKLNPEHAAAFNNMGVVMFQLEKFDRAIVLFKEAVRINPNFNDARNNLASAARAKKADAADFSENGSK
ncbi:MAG: tetratricopeptide repeat protein [Desulfobacterales bacterium]|jgi:tetratricopeptide (TPR) repeat protein